VDRKQIAKALVALIIVAAVFATGLFFGRTGGPGDFTVTTQYAVGAMDEEEIETLAQRLEDRAERETEAVAGQTAASAPETTPAPMPPPAPDDGRVNINTADHQALQVLPGVGPAIAQRIIDHREAHGLFRMIEEITDVSGIGPARFDNMREMITVE